MSEHNERNYALLTAARANEDIRCDSQVREDFSKEERLVAASAPPAALMAELDVRIRRAQTDCGQEFACMAPPKKKKKTAESKHEDVEWSIPVAPPGPPTKAPSMWQSGTVKSKRPSTLCVPAAGVLMGRLYCAWMARHDLLRPVQSLGTDLRGSECDDRLHRLVSYVQPTFHLIQVAWVGDAVAELGQRLYADADFAGCPRTLRSTSGYHLTIEGPGSSMPQVGASARQTALFNSTPEVESTAGHLAHKKACLPGLDPVWLHFLQGISQGHA